MRGLGDRWLLLEHVPDTRAGDEGPLPARDHFAEALHRPDEHIEELQRGHQLAGRHVAIEGEPAAIAENDQLADPRQEVEERAVDRAQPDHFHRVAMDVTGDLLHAADLVLLPAEGAHQPGAGDALFDHAGEAGEANLHAFGTRFELAEEPHAEPRHHRVDRHRQEGQRDVHAEEEEERASRHQEVGGVNRDVDEEALDLVEVDTSAGHQLAGRRPVVVVEREAVDAVVELHAQVGFDAVARAQSPVAAGAREDGLERDDHHEQDHQPHEQPVVLVDDSAVDSEARDDRDDEAQQPPTEAGDERDKQR